MLRASVTSVSKFNLLRFGRQVHRYVTVWTYRRLNRFNPAVRQPCFNQPVGTAYLTLIGYGEHGIVFLKISVGKGEVTITLGTPSDSPRPHPFRAVIDP